MATAWLMRLAFALAAILLPATANAQPFGRVQPHCFAVTDKPAPPASGCTLSPSNYQHRWLWAELPAPSAGDATWRVVVRQSRFDRLVAVFRYADGAERRLEVASGDFGTHWRVGGKLAFDPPPRAAAVRSVSLGFHRLAAHELLRIRLSPVSVADRNEELALLVTGAALALLGFSAAYNVGMGIGSRRRFVLWHAAWATCVFVWGLLWTQTALLLAPGLAGAPAVGGSITLSALAIACAGWFFAGSLEAGTLPGWARRTLITIAAAVAVLGAFTGFGPRDWMTPLGQALGLSVLATAATIAITATVAIRAGSRAARDFAISWAIPIAAVLWTFVTDHGLTADDDSGQLMVLAVCALQTVGLSLIIGRRLAWARRERDEAQAREAQFKTLADTDPLTGLYNRRGFVARAEAALAAPEPVALVLLDLDHFKSINDSFGHEAGDRVLFSVAAALRGLSGEALVGRLGGEEFGVVVTGATGPALARLTERLRRGIAALRFGPSPGPAGITASFGVAEAKGPHQAFEPLYRAADRALYRAKAQGRNCVVIDDGDASPSRPALAG